MEAMKTTDLGEVKKVFRFKNDGDKLSRQLLSLVDFSRGNNYESSHIEVRVFDNDMVEISTFYTNEYGSRWCNENHTKVEKSEIPFFTLKKLGLI
jgi:predicted metalloenzyme YecM